MKIWLAVLCNIIFFVMVLAQVLGTMTVEEIEKPPPYINTDPNRAVLVVYSDIENIGFATNNKGVIEIRKLERGIFLVFLYPGTHLMTFSAEGFRSIDDFRIFIPPKEVKSVQVKAATPPPAGNGNLRLETVPPGANVKFNNIPFPDRTPITLENQPSGRHSLRLELEGYAPLDTFALIERDKTATLRLSLLKLIAGLKVTSDPPGATIYLDGEILGNTPVEKQDLAPGERSLFVELEGYIAVNQMVRLTADKTVEVPIFLQKQTGTVEITTIPSGADLFLDNISLGKFENSPIFKDKLTLGEHTAKAVLAGYDTAFTTFTLNFNEVRKIELNLKGKTGSLFVGSTPKGADILLDGQDTGFNTSVKIDDLSPGSHQLTLRNSGYQDTTRIVIISPEKTETVNVVMIPGISSPSIEAGKDEYLLDKIKKTSLGPYPIRFGIKFASIGVGIVNSPFYIEDKSSGYHCGAYFEYKLSEKNSLQTEFLISKIRYENNFLNGDDDFIELPVIFKRCIFSRQNNFGFLYLGFAPAFRTYQNFDYHFAYFRPNLIAGFDVEYKRALFGFRWNRGLNQIGENNSVLGESEYSNAEIFFGYSFKNAGQLNEDWRKRMELLKKKPEAKKGRWGVMLGYYIIDLSHADFINVDTYEQWPTLTVLHIRDLGKNFLFQAGLSNFSINTGIKDTTIFMPWGTGRTIDEKSDYLKISTSMKYNLYRNNNFKLQPFLGTAVGLFIKGDHDYDRAQEFFEIGIDVIYKHLITDIKLSNSIEAIGQENTVLESAKINIFQFNIGYLF